MPHPRKKRRFRPRGPDVVKGGHTSTRPFPLSLCSSVPRSTEIIGPHEASHAQQLGSAGSWRRVRGRANPVGVRLVHLPALSLRRSPSLSPLRRVLWYASILLYQSRQGRPPWANVCTSASSSHPSLYLAAAWARKLLTLRRRSGLPLASVARIAHSSPTGLRLWRQALQGGRTPCSAPTAAPASISFDQWAPISAPERDLGGLQHARGRGVAATP